MSILVVVSRLTRCRSPKRIILESPEGVERILTDRPVTTQVLPRDKLVGVLYDHIRDNYSQQVELNYGYEVTPLDLGSGDGSSVLLRYVLASLAVSLVMYYYSSS